jgi:hypothetical protein
VSHVRGVVEGGGGRKEKLPTLIIGRVQVQASNLSRHVRSTTTQIWSAVSQKNEDPSSIGIYRFGNDCGGGGGGGGGTVLLVEWPC